MLVESFYLPFSVVLVLMGLYIVTTRVEVEEVNNMVPAHEHKRCWEIGFNSIKMESPFHIRRHTTLAWLFHHMFFSLLGPQKSIWGFLQLHICLFIYVLKGVILLSKGHVHAEKAIAFRSTRQKNHVTRSLYIQVWLQWQASLMLYYIPLIFLGFATFCLVYSESLFVRAAGRRLPFITTYRLLTPLSYCFLFLIYCHLSLITGMSESLPRGRNCGTQLLSENHFLIWLV